MGIEREPGGLRISVTTHSGIAGGISYAFGSGKRLVATFLLTLGVYCLFVLSTFPTYSAQMLASGRIGRAVQTLTRHLQVTSGYVGLFLTAVYAVLAGVTGTVSHGAVRGRKLPKAGHITGVIPAVLAAGCASCGAGAVGVLGLVGTAPLIPASGNLIRLFGIALLAVLLMRIGDPRRCETD